MSKRQAHRLRRQLRREKRGVVLLVVVSLLTLFLMIGVTYVLIAGNYKNASGQALLARRFGDESEREMDEVIGQIMFGTPQVGGSHSVIGPHSLLGDLYGNDGVVGFIGNNPPTLLNGGQTLYFSINPLAQPQPIPNYFAGRVITFTNGSAAGLSSRVMAYYPTGANGSGTPELMVETPESDLPIPVQPSSRDRFIINGAPFNGTGAGYSFGTQNLDNMIAIPNGSGTQYPIALLPNIFNIPPNWLPPGSLPAAGGLDEPWDAADYQNMPLAMVPPQKTGQYDGFPLLPSFHRPDLALYWMNTLSGSLLSGASNPQNAFLYPYGPDGKPGTGDEDPGLMPNQADELVALKRMFIFRPLREDHPNFTGGNQNFLETNLSGPYDVDNDGDGITDSIWIDAGLPIVTAPNGRRYKRLVAVLIKDLDGRVNPTVHGNLVIANDPNARTVTPITDTVAGTDPTNPQQIYAPRGLGFGPAEFDFQHLFQPNTYPAPLPPLGDQTVYNNILQQRYVGPTGGMGLPGYPNQDDVWSQLRTIGLPDIHPITQQVVSSYATPPDVWGRAALAVDYTGQPLWYPPSLTTISERMDDPYEIQWNPLQASWDSPYTVSELESLLRYHDLGAAAIPSRLMLYAGYGNPAGNYLATESRGTVGPSQRLREAFGMGSHIPAPKMVVPRELRQVLLNLYGQNYKGYSILDLYVAAIVNGRGWGAIPSAPADPNLAPFYDQLRAEVPFELFKGQMFNINREFGNGQNDMTGVDPYGIVDDPSETSLPEQIPTTGGPANFDYLNDADPANTSDSLGNPDPRQMMARHLYCLMMLLRNRSWQINQDLNLDGAINDRDNARFFAQWAVNVVDFRDADSINTGFKYDIDPFDQNGWSVDANLQNTLDIQGGIGGGVVWGVERPELLITETLAVHDLRTEDLANDQFNGMNNGKTSDPTKENDGLPDFDQQLKPWGSAFLELYNPWYDRGTNGNQNFYDHKPAELYTTSANGVAGVDLSRVSPTGNSPVWRLLIVRGQPQVPPLGPQPHYVADPDAPQPESLTEGTGGVVPPPNYVDRTVYFADLNSAGTYPNTPQYGDIFFPSGGIPRAPILPGRYAVVGSSGNIPGMQYTTTFGRLTTAMGGYDPSVQDYGDTRRIVMIPDANPDNSSVQIYDNLTSGATDIDPTTILPVVALPIDSVIPMGGGGVPQPQSFNISEPVGGYPAAFAGASMYSPPGANDEGHFVPPVDQPFDAQRMDDGNIFGTTGQTVANYRTVHLQRLANPLLAWNSLTNPYITVDKSSFDVTPFNGVYPTPDPSVIVKQRNLQTFQRGGRFNATDAAPDNAPWNAVAAPNRLFRDLWPEEDYASEVLPPTTLDSPPESTGPHNFPRSLHHTLGFLNKRYQPGLGQTAGNYRGAPSFQDATTGGPAPPFPYLAFNNRPFNSPMELLNVPCWSSSKLLEKFYFQSTDPMSPQGTFWNNMYLPPNPQTDTYPYGHILNFFHTDQTLTIGSNTAPEISRLFDFVETRTPFASTEKYYTPAQFVSPNPSPTGFRPPYNYLSRFREPGRLNLNTIYDDAIWNAAVRGSPGMCSFNQPEGDGGQFFTRLLLSRQGWGGANGASDVLTIANYDGTHPSYFSNPFRTGDSADMMPSAPASLRLPVSDGGLLRRDNQLTNVPPLTQPPFPIFPTLDPNNPQPLFATESVTPSQDAARNPYFRFQPLQKVGNLFSTNSNCYAVWLTIGYFEVEGNDADNNPSTPPVVDLAHPEGVRLAQELGVDEGNVKRHRAFYIIDRSVPVGYEPGHRHNTDKAVLLKRFIE